MTELHDAKPGEDRTEYLAAAMEQSHASNSGVGLTIHFRDFEQIAQLAHRNQSK